jgi:hypothetical protein
MRMRAGGIIMAAVAAFAMNVAAAQAASPLHESYGECTYACDATHRLCVQKQGKLAGGIERCDAQRQACRERCDTLRDKDKPLKPKQQ